MAKTFVRGVIIWFCGWLRHRPVEVVDSCVNRCYLVTTTPARFGGRAQGCRKAALAFLEDGSVIRTTVYIDGLNLYHRALRDTPHRWLNLGELAQMLLPTHQINRIRYFTARVRNRPSDPTQAQRQQAYLRALGTIPDLTIHYGRLVPRTKRRPLATPPQTGPRFVEVLDTEEKGSDVNLASYLLVDGFDNEYELAVVVSNDSDLELPISMTRTKLGKQVGVFDPSDRRSFHLSNAASWYRPLRAGPLSASQFPTILHDTKGPITKPASW